MTSIKNNILPILIILLLIISNFYTWKLTSDYLEYRAEKEKVALIVDLNNRLTESIKTNNDTVAQLFTRYDEIDVTLDKIYTKVGKTIKVTTPECQPSRELTDYWRTLNEQTTKSNNFNTNN